MGNEPIISRLAQFGAPFIGAFATCDPTAIRDYVQAVEEMGSSHLFVDEGKRFFVVVVQEFTLHY